MEKNILPQISKNSNNELKTTSFSKFQHTCNLNQLKNHDEGFNPELKGLKNLVNMKSSFQCFLESKFESPFYCSNNLFSLKNIAQTANITPFEKNNEMTISSNLHFITKKDKIIDTIKKNERFGAPVKNNKLVFRNNTKLEKNEVVKANLEHYKIEYLNTEFLNSNSDNSLKPDFEKTLLFEDDQPLPIYITKNEEGDYCFLEEYLDESIKEEFIKNNECNIYRKKNKCKNKEQKKF